VERVSGGRLALREFEVYRVPEAELQRVAALRTEKVTERFTDTILISHTGPGARQYGEYSFDGEIALLRRDGQGQVTRVSLKDGARLADAHGLSLTASEAPAYCNITLAEGNAVVEGAGAAGVQLTLNGAAVKLTGTPAAAAARPEITAAKAVLEPAQAGFTGAQPSALITWRTSVPATTQALFGEEGRFDRRTVLDPKLTTEHQARAWFLKPDQPYTFRIQSRTAGGAIAAVDVPAR
jgi:hypothetical protein